MPSLLLEIGASVARLQADIAKAQRTVDGFAKSAKAAFGGIFAGASIYGVASFIKGTLDAADSMAKLSEKVGISVEDLSEYKHIAELSGTSVEQFAKGMQILSRNMVDTAQGTGEAKDAFKLLGVSVVEADGKLRTNQQVMLDVAERFSKMEDGAAKTALAMRMFGKSGADLIPTLNEGRAGLEKLGAEVDALGIRMTTDFAEAAEEVNDNIDRMIKGVGGAAMQLTQALMPALQTVSKWLVDAAEHWALFYGQSEKMVSTRKRMSILDDLKEVEQKISELEKGPTTDAGKIYDRLFGRGTEAGKIELETARLRKAELEKEFEAINKTMREIDDAASKKKPTGKLPSPMLEDSAAIEKAKKAQEKYLADQKKQAKEMETAWKEVWASQNLVSEHGWEDYASGLNDVGEGVRSLTRDTITARNEAETFFGTIEKTKDLIKDFGWEDYAAGLEGASDIEREANQNRIAAMSDTTDKMVDLTENAANAMEDNFSDLFFNVMTGKFQDLGDFATGIFESIARAGSDYLGQLATEFLFGEQQKSGRSGGFLKTILSAAGGAGSGSMGGASVAMDAISALAMIHGGGQVGRDSFPSKWVTAGAFAGAQRLHGGLASDEYPAILQKGETVIPKGGEGQTQQSPPLNIMINAVDSVSFAQMAARNPSAITGPIMEALQKGGQLRNMIRGVI